MFPEEANLDKISQIRTVRLGKGCTAVFDPACGREYFCRGADQPGTPDVGDGNG